MTTTHLFEVLRDEPNRFEPPMAQFNMRLCDYGGDLLYSFSYPAYKALQKTALQMSEVLIVTKNLDVVLIQDTSRHTLFKMRRVHP